MFEKLDSTFERSDYEVKNESKETWGDDLNLTDW